ncbi:putative aminopeptidase W07G4.4 [Maylandia zebra]|uniref:Zgc:152830 n=2 Tax=Haplochromini TaxID=319058 RepID=A0A3P9BRJ8_9CICH|nr:putative aminopeptidase W07G4.4 [Maylandia zebra]XP_026043228.1 putative aminopeptidase W07G4.4 [Astatotilapia calliptera]XP_039906454.1 putative aminopeptidase W07G4.4 [Simochromis diagramma]
MCTSVQPIQWTSDLRNQNFDGIVLVTQSHESLPSELESLKAPLQDYSAVDSGLGEEVVVIKVPGLPGNRLVFASTGPVNRDYDDIRRFSDAAVNGIQRALKAGMQRPLLVCPPHADYKNNTLVAALGALHALYMPLEVRESNVKKNDHKVCVLGLWAAEEARGTKLVELANALENGRLAYRDIGGSDPERMAAPRVADYVQELFKDSPVKVEVVSDLKTLEKEYPCLAAVNRCANSVPRHQARVVKLQYCGEGPIEKTLMLVGKGITYDTGGADIKAGGVMAGMHRDKCGAAAVAGFFQIVAQLKPQHLKVVGVMAMVRNSVGADCYVADELVVSRAGRRVRVGNTDAEGRMVMVDLLCEMKEKAVNEVSPQLFTIATLTGHAIRAMGPNYSIIMDNGPAHRSGNAAQWQKAGEVLGDLFEVSTIRREDYEFHKGQSEYEDILQCNNLPSSATPRGHQTPAAFLIMASGLDKHGVDSEAPLPYSHIDIAGSSGPFPGVPTGAPIVTMATNYILSDL